jgi:steroid Delta-isomerase
MASPDDITTTVKRYLELAARGSADEIAALYADDATVEDPVGSELRRGRDAIREFYAAVENLERHVELEAIRVAGNEAAYLFNLTIKLGDNWTHIAPIGVMTFDDDAKITSMRAYWSPSDLTTR